MEESNKYSKPLGATDEPDSEVIGPQSDTYCYHDGYKYSPGATKCIDGIKHLCTQSGRWNHFNEKC